MAHIQILARGTRAIFVNHALRCRKVLVSHLVNQKPASKAYSLSPQAANLKCGSMHDLIILETPPQVGRIDAAQLVLPQQLLHIVPVELRLEEVDDLEAAARDLGGLALSTSVDHLAAGKLALVDGLTPAHHVTELDF